MKNFRIIEPQELNDSNRYQLVEAGIYNDLQDSGRYATHRMAMAMEPEEGEDSQYPLEDILDHFLVHVEIFLDETEPGVFQCIFGGDRDNLQKLKTIIGKRAFNEDFVDDDGKTRVRLKIE